ncbi:hypothetical protein [Effusibacillus dendaii]|uniref:Uncharacterized protein n=1 Tax=Effusibacillus dendaii TaxID=2743772 RepID=A0A7I8D706_9BACL|nr:hypothetical protein [Effusibacillus dendaii]BCJ85777.1 hypothetical protein skT53_07620 [Effusibacillus dendaii]
MTDKHHSPAFSLTPLPKSYDHRASMKWITIESLRVVLERLNAHTEQKAVFLTSIGLIEGELVDIAASFAESFDEETDTRQSVPQVTSMVANVRVELLRVVEKDEKELRLTDSAPLIGLRNATIHLPDRAVHLPEVTLFADQVVGFAVEPQQVH